MFPTNVKVIKLNSHELRESKGDYQAPEGWFIFSKHITNGPTHEITIGEISSCVVSKDVSSAIERQRMIIAKITLGYPEYEKMLSWKSGELYLKDSKVIVDEVGGITVNNYQENSEKVLGHIYEKQRG